MTALINLNTLKQNNSVLSWVNQIQLSYVLEKLSFFKLLFSVKMFMSSTLVQVIILHEKFHFFSENTKANPENY